MTTTETNKTSGDRRGFFTIYKPGQGKFVRWSTVAAIVLMTGLAMFWAFMFVRQYAVAPGAKNASGAPVNLDETRLDGLAWVVIGAIALLGAFLAFVAANRPRSAEFMIMTESEMRKVTWPTRATVINSTKVVIVLTLIMALILASIDAMFMGLFRWMHIL